MKGYKNESVNSTDSFVIEFIVKEQCYCKSLPSSWDWILDSASTSHVCQNK